MSIQIPRSIARDRDFVGFLNAILAKIGLATLEKEGLVKRAQAPLTVGASGVAVSPTYQAIEIEAIQQNLNAQIVAYNDLTAKLRAAGLVE